jgi:hypothetical protein
MHQTCMEFERHELVHVPGFCKPGAHSGAVRLERTSCVFVRQQHLSMLTARADSREVSGTRLLI